MNFITIFVNDFKLSVRNRVSFIVLLLMPIMMIALMGYALKPMFENGQLEKFTVLYLNEDTGQVGKTLDNFLRSAGATQFDLLSVTPEILESEIKTGKYPVALRVSQDLSARLARGEGAEIEVVSSQQDPIKEEITRSMVNAFLTSYNSQRGLGITYEQYSKYLPLEPLEGTTQPEEFTSVHIVGLNSSLSSFQFFAASMLVFFLLTTGMGIGVNLINERTDKIYRRISTFPVTKNQYLFGKVLNSLFMAVLQSSSVILFTKYAFKVEWGTNFFGLGLIIILIILISSSIGIICASLLDSTKALTVLLAVFFWFMTFISGGFTTKPVLGLVADFTINKWAFNALVGLMLGKDLTDIAQYLLPLVLVSLVLWGIGLTAYNRRLSYE